MNQEKPFIGIASFFDQNGEVFENRHIAEMLPGDRIIRKKQSDAFSKKIYYKKTHDDFGDFTILFYKPRYPLKPDVSPANLTRLVYLSTYLSYQGFLANTTYGHSRVYNRLDCCDILQVSKGTFDNFWSEMISKNIIIYRDKQIHLCTEYFQRGEVKKESAFMRLNIEGIQSLYKSNLDTNVHKNLSYIFKIIPLVNKEWNIVCRNPDEKDLSLIEPLTLTEFAKVLLYAPAHARRLCNTLTSFHFTWNHSDVQAFRYTTALNDPKKKWISIDPRLYYAGTDFKQAIKIATDSH